LANLLTAFGYWAVVVLVALEGFGIPLPGETMLITAAIYAGATHQMSLPLIIAAAFAGAVVGSTGGYAIGYWGGFRLLIRFGKYIRLHEPRVKLGRYLFLRHGGKVVFFGRFISILRTYAAFLAGTARMPAWRFLSSTWLVRSPGRVSGPSSPTALASRSTASPGPRTSPWEWRPWRRWSVSTSSGAATNTA
jgi:membrane protein DedA with SNARE-associated domain